MRSKIAVLTGMLCLLATVAAADITSVSPQSFTPSGEDYLTINGTNLLGTTGTQIIFDGLHVVDEPNFAIDTQIVTWIPTAVLAEEGQHSVVVHSLDGTAVRVHGPAFFTVQAPPDPVGPPILFVPEEGVSAEATDRTGGIVDFVVSALSAGGDDVPVTCSPASGTHFALGFTDVVCSATDTGGTTVRGFTVFVTDTTPPVVTVPEDIVTPNPVVTFTASATDAVDGNLDVTCSPASGSTFETGTTQVQCSAVDSHANMATASFSVQVTTGPPVLILPPDIVTESTSAAGAVVHYAVSSDGGGTVTCTPVSGSTFPIGTTLVNCTATNADGSTPGSFNVTVRDSTLPVVTVPADIVVTTTTPPAIVSFTATATDAVDGAIPVTCNPASGSEFDLGFTVVVCTARNSRGNVGTADFLVTVRETVPDTTPPVLFLPAPITVEATSNAGATVSYSASAVDAIDGVRPISCAPASGSTFPIAITTVMCSASDLSGNVATGSFSITVRDTTPPTLTLPSEVRGEATSPAGAALTFTTSATDIVDGTRPVTCTPPSGSVFPVGTTVVQCSASDTRGNTANGSFNAIVEDTTPPEIISISASPGSLWPPNHKMVDVAVTVVAVDTADPSPVSHIVSVSSNQPVNGTGDGDTAPDWEITGPLTLKLRAERSGSAERIYTIVVECSDASGNTTTGTVTVKVAGSKGRAMR